MKLFSLQGQWLLSVTKIYFFSVYGKITRALTKEEFKSWFLKNFNLRTSVKPESLWGNYCGKLNILLFGEAT